MDKWLDSLERTVKLAYFSLLFFHLVGPSFLSCRLKSLSWVHWSMDLIFLCQRMSIKHLLFYLKNCFCFYCWLSLKLGFLLYQERDFSKVNQYRRFRPGQQGNFVWMFPWHLVTHINQWLCIAFLLHFHRQTQHSIYVHLARMVRTWLAQSLSHSS